MRAEEFSAWLSAIAVLSAAQRQEALRALEGANGEGSDPAPGDLAQGPAKKGAKRRGSARNDQS
jgi:hypothetical protein